MDRTESHAVKCFLLLKKVPSSYMRARMRSERDSNWQTTLAAITKLSNIVNQLGPEVRIRPAPPASPKDQRNDGGRHVLRAWARDSGALVAPESGR